MNNNTNTSNDTKLQAKKSPLEKDSKLGVNLDAGLKHLSQSLTFEFSKINKNGDILTKKVNLVENKLVSDASECRMSRGKSTKVSLTLPEFPEFLSGLSFSEAIATGWVDGPADQYALLPKEAYLSENYTLPIHHADHGSYSTRTKESFTQEGSSLIVFDYDHDETAKLQISCPEQFIEVLANVIPNFDKVSYVRTFSTSSSIYQTSTDKCLRPAEGFHIYMVVEDGSDLKAFGERLNDRLWLEGFGHVKVSKSGALLKRTLVDTAVFSPERLIFEAGAVCGPDLEQRLPSPEYVAKPLASLNTSWVKKLTAKEEQARVIQEKLVKTSEATLQRQGEVRKQLVQALLAKHKGQGKPLTSRQAERVIDAKIQYKLTYDTEVFFENGDVLTIAELLFKADEYDKHFCLDPLREDKGYGKCQFYANTESGMPIINSFIEGGRVYKLNDSISIENELSDQHQESEFRKITDDVRVQENRYLALETINPGVTLIKSQKGTGKTFGVAEWLLANPQHRVLNITHRVSLARALGTKFNNDIYNDEEMTLTKLVGSNKLSCCYDSVHKLSRQHYEVVVIDEAVQVMRHIIADTVKEKFLSLNVLVNIILNAKYLILMDADLQASHIKFLQEMLVLNPKSPIQVELNTFQPAKGHVAEVLEDSDGRPDELGLLERMAEEARVTGLFYASNSVRDVELKAEQVANELGLSLRVQKGDFILKAGGRRFIMITGNNSSNPEVQEFIDNINDRLLPTDLVFCSPSMGTGISIDSVDGNPKFKKVFARFTKRAGNIPSDCLQHMSRVRDCESVAMILVDDTSYQCIDPEQIIEQKLMTAVRLIDSKTNPFNHCLNFDSWTGQYTWADSGYSHWLGFIKGMEAQDRNAFAENLKLQLEQEGYSVRINRLHVDLEALDARVNLNKRVKAQKVDARDFEFELRRNTPLIDDETYKALKDKRNLRMCDRRKVEKKYYAQVMGMTKKLDVDDFICVSDARIKNRIGGLTLGMNPDSLLIQELGDRVNHYKQHLDKTISFERYQLVVGLAKIFGVEVHNRKVEDTQLEITEEIMEEAHAYLSEKPNVCRRVFGLSVAKKLEDQQRSQKVLAVLKKIGLSTRRTSIKEGKEVKRIRRITDESILTLNTDIARAKKLSVLVGYNDPKPTGDLDTFLLYNESGLGSMMPQVHNYLLSLSPQYLLDLNRILKLKGSKALRADWGEGEPQYG